MNASLVGQQDAFAEEVWVRTAVHLPLDHFDAVDVAFDGPRAVGQGEAGGDGVLVAAQASDERVQLGEVVAKHSSHPGLKLSAAAVHHHLGELADTSAQGGKLRAGGAQRIESALFVGLEVGGVAKEPAGGLPDRRWPLRNWCNGQTGPPGPEVLADSSVPAAVTEAAQFLAELCGVPLCQTAVRHGTYEFL